MITDKDSREWAAKMQWLGLDVLHSEQQGDVGFVEFIATFKPPNVPQHQMRENSKVK